MDGEVQVLLENEPLGVSAQHDYDQNFFAQFGEPLLAEKPRKGIPSLADLVAEKKKGTAEKARAQARLAEYDVQRKGQGPAATVDFEPLPLELPTPVAAAASAAPEPARLQRCLFPEQASLSDADPSFGSCDLQAACNEGASGADIGEAARQLLLGGLLQQHYTRQGSCPEAVSRQLFSLLCSSTQRQVASAALATFLALMAPLQTRHKTTGEPQYCEFEWLPSDSDFLKALQPLGYKQPESQSSCPGSGAPGTARSKGGRRASASTPVKPDKPPSGAAAAAAAASVTPMKRPRNGSSDGAAACTLPLLNLRLLLQCLSAVAQRDTDVPRRGGLRPQGLVELTVKLLELRLDPVGRNLAGVINKAVAAVVGGISEKEWLSHFPKLAAAVAAVGPSHRATLELLKGLLRGPPRVCLLGQHAAVLLLWRLLPMGSNDRGAAPATDARQEIDAQDVTSRLWWMLKPRMILKGLSKTPAKFDVYEVDTAFKVADELLWRQLRGSCPAYNGGESGGSRTELAHQSAGSWRNLLTTLSKECRRLGGPMQIPGLQLASAADMAEKRNTMADSAD